MSTPESGQQPQLFRQQVIEKRRQRLIGEVVLQDSGASSTFVWIVGAFCLALLIWAGTAKYPRTTQVSGVVTTTTPSSKVYAKRPGTVARLMVKEGQFVRQGDTLALVDADLRDADSHALSGDMLDSFGRDSANVSRQLTSAHGATESERERLAAMLAGLAREKASLSNQLSYQRALVASMESSFGRLAPLSEKGFISKIEMERRQQVMLGERGREQQLAQQLAQLDSRTADLLAQQRRLALNLVDRDSEIQSRLEAIEQQRSRVRIESAFAITAPISGRVTSLQTAVGKSIDGRLPLMAVVPEGARFAAELFAPTAAVGFLRAGQQVRVMYDAYPYKQFGTFAGTVATVSRSALAPTELDVPIKASEPVYRVQVALADRAASRRARDLALQSGMTLSAVVILERRSFFEWLLEPLNAVRSRQ
jgi:membrane fusion protein